MADDLDAELLALAGDSEEEHSPPPQEKDDSPAPSGSPHLSERDQSPDTMGRRGTAKPARRARKAVRDEEEGEISDAESHNSLDSAPMSESDSEGNNATDDEDRPIFPYDKLYYSAKEKEEIMAMPEIQREELLSERAQQVDRHNQDLALRRLLASREREEARAAAKQAKRKAGSAGLDESQRKSSRQKTTLGGRKVGETSAAIDAYKRQREQKGKRDELRRRITNQSRRRSRSQGSDISNEDAEAESDLELDDRVGRSPSVPKDDPPAELRDIQRARVGRSNFAQVCFYPGFEEAITGCYARVNIGPNMETGQNEYRLCLITGRVACFTQGKSYAMEAPNGRPFATDQYAKLAHGKAVRDFPFIACSDSQFTENEYNRYRKTMTVEDCKMATQSKVASKVGDINRLINHQFTAEELSHKLRRQGALDEKSTIRRRFDLERDLHFAKVNGNTEEAEKLQKELDDINNPKLSWGTTLVKQQAPEKTLSEAERVHQINLRNQKLNYENVRRAQLEERKAARKAAAAVARGEAAADPFMRVRTIAKTHHDVNEKPQESKSVDTTPADTPKDSPKPVTSNSSQLATPKSSLTPKKTKSGFMISYRNNDDENIAALDLDIDIDI
ncbi:hypothetical protein N7462_001830 [Penicillium macrosclerotiorum]|uniref:uncharacterized protein n=1 Tax=Penicillium macrosclerotiorum TaxID=303699 RepID=UPI00254744A1|nr:uncharacterized protein N7462_001830 [Penicillium macrosclerotiorum]KAJ5692407.1 hypothetical protein N7462_001830 [Penicillium macrosclerotiorum]